MLNEYELLNYLFDNKLLEKESFVNGNISIVNVSRRNYNSLILNKGKSSYLIKQGVGKEGQTIHNEALIYNVLRKNSTNSNSSITPRMYNYDYKKNLIVLEALSNSKNLREHIISQRSFSSKIALKIGKILGEIHKIRADEFKEISVLHSADLGLMAYNPDITNYQYLSSSNIQLIKIIHQFPEFCRLLDEANETWTPQSLTHCDIKWDNFLVEKSVKQKTELKLVDWELACIGDPCWDVGSIFSEYLVFWILSVPFTKEIPTDKDLEIIPYPLKAIKPAISIFWTSYSDAMNLNSSKTSWLIRSMKFSAVKMVLTAFELGQNSLFLGGNSVWILQLAYNILQKPYEALVRLLGISL